MRHLSVIILMLCTLTALGQKEASVWYFGLRGAGLDFNCNPPTAIRGAMYYNQEGCSSTSDASGNILFYTDGDTVRNRLHQVMPNGFGIGNQPGCWGSSTQGAIIIPVPSSETLYYIFTVDCVDEIVSNGLRYSIVDMSLNGGFGDVTDKFQPLHSDMTEKLAAVHHANGEDIWVLAHEHGTNVFLAYLVSSAGLNTAPIISNAGQAHAMPTLSNRMGKGYMKFSPNGQKLIVTSISDQHVYTIYPELFSFDDATGQVSLDYTIVDLDSTNYYGSSFSPDNSLLYLSGGWRGQYVHQFDATALSSNDFLASKQVIFAPTGDSRPSAIQIGPDGKLYVASRQAWIDVIHNPNTYGLNCNYQSPEITFNDCPTVSQSFYGLPNFPESYFRSSFTGDQCVDIIEAGFLYSDSCFGTQTTFQDNTEIFPEIATNWSWSFGDPLSGVDNTSTLQNPTHQFTSEGLYSVTLIASSDAAGMCKTDTVVQTVHIDVCTGIPENYGASGQVSTYPNPFSSFSTIELVNVPPADIEVFSCSGQKIEHISHDGNPIRSYEIGEEYEAGLYFVLLKTEVGTTTKYLVKIE